MKQGKFKLKKQDREKLEELIKGKGTSTRVFKRASGLLELEQGKEYEEIARSLGVTRHTIGDWRSKYEERGLKFLNDAHRPGRPKTFDGAERAKITALACSEAPEGYGGWSLRLLADKVVELGYCEEISHAQVGLILKKTNSSRTSRKRGASGK